MDRFVARIAAVGAAALAATCVLIAPTAQAQGFPKGAQEALGPLYRSNRYAQREAKRPSHRDTTPQGMLRHWNAVAIDASGLDHTPVAEGEPRAFDEQLARDLVAIHDQRPKQLGIELGQRAARRILDLRAGDGSAHGEPPVEIMASLVPGGWRQDPVSLVPIALGGYWGTVAPFVMDDGAQFRAPRPPALGSQTTHGPTPRQRSSAATAS